MRLLPFFAVLAGAALFLPHCGSTGDSCDVAASAYSNECDTDSDCVAAPPGGDSCDVCDDPETAQTFWCSTTVVSKKTAAAYLAKVAAVQSHMNDVNGSGGFCSASCPIGGGNVACVGGKCVGTP